jgi:predicted nucleotidyltransferase
LSDDFKIQDKLQQDLWNDEQLDPKVRDKLLEIAEEFMQTLNIPGLTVEDIVITGSLANYNWTKLSDVDLHIMVDFDKLKLDPELLRDFFNLKKMAWNNTHDIKIYGFEVEAYVQDISEPHHSTGVYSVQNDEWVTKPVKEKPVINIKGANKKAESFMRSIDSLERMSDVTAYQKATEIKDKIKKLRKCGLEKGGEYSTENIAFKMLRRNGYLEKLNNLKNFAYDSLHSLKENKKK